MSGQILTGRGFGSDVLKAIGLGDVRHVCDFSIHVPVTGAVRVKAEILLDQQQGGELVRALREYRLRAEEDKP